MGDVVFSVSPPGVNVTQVQKSSQLTMNTKYPFHKLDVTNQVSFQNINLSFTQNAPFPANPGSGLVDYRVTPVYQFAHGYKYIPATWVMDLNNYEAPDQSTFPTYQNGNLVLLGFVGGSNGGSTTVALWTSADATNVYLKLIAQVLGDNSGLFPSPTVNITGFTVKLRIFVFAEDLQAN